MFVFSLNPDLFIYLFLPMIEVREDPTLNCFAYAAMYYWSSAFQTKRSV